MVLSIFRKGCTYHWLNPTFMTIDYQKFGIYVAQLKAQCHSKRKYKYGMSKFDSQMTLTWYNVEILWKTWELDVHKDLE